LTEIAQTSRRVVVVAALYIGALLSASACASYAGSARSVTSSQIERERGWSRVSGVPFVRQEHASDCGPAALSSVLQYWGLDDARESIERALEKPGQPAGTLAGDLRDYARTRGLRAYVFGGTLRDIQHELALGRPVIAGVHQRLTSERVLRHYVVVVGYHEDRGQILLVDPARGLRRDSVKGFVEEWSGSERLLLVVFPAGEVTVAGRLRPWSSDRLTRTQNRPEKSPHRG
jgi:ABC-type bacteriocin/lantibiotic exporter with double-glycine peptidase domain